MPEFSVLISTAVTPTSPSLYSARGHPTNTGSGQSRKWSWIAWTGGRSPERTAVHRTFFLPYWLASTLKIQTPSPEFFLAIGDFMA